MSEQILTLVLVVLAVGGVILVYRLRKHGPAPRESTPAPILGISDSGDVGGESLHEATGGSKGETPPNLHDAAKPASSEPDVTPASFAPEGNEDAPDAGPGQKRPLAQSVDAQPVGDKEVPQPIAEHTSRGDATDSNLTEPPDQATAEGTRAAEGGEGVPPQHEGIEDRPRGVQGTGVGDNLIPMEEQASAGVAHDQERAAGVGLDAELQMAEKPETMDTAGTPPETTDQIPVVEALVVELEESVSTPTEEEGEGDPTPTTTHQPPRRKEKAPKEKKPRKYPGLSRAAPQPQDDRRTTPPHDEVEPATRDRSLALEVRLLFDRGGFCTVSLIARRTNGLPEEIAVATRSGELELQALQDEWYQDVVPGDISRVLREGTVWTEKAAAGGCTWSLSGRDLYVLADRPDIRGFVSQACLELGREHAVLCSAGIRARVEEAIKKTGAGPTAVMDESLGTPPGWVVFRGVVPTIPVAPVDGADIFNALRPLPRIEISLERGVRYDYANWLQGYPPSIRVYGDPQHTTEVRIDGQIAVLGADGCYQASGWDSIGSHTVWCGGISKSYSVVPFAASWEWCDAYVFPVSFRSQRRIAICGPMVRSVPEGPQSEFFSVSVPETHPVLLGRTPGQHAYAQGVSGLRGAPLISSPPFSPVWALPPDPLHCDKESVRILLIGELVLPEAVGADLTGTRKRRDGSIDAWCRLILDANRKGMKTQPDTESVRALWSQYKQLARRIWRTRK